MKVLDATIDWMQDYANLPSMKILVDEIPEMEELRFTQKGSLYYAELDGYVMFFSYTVPDKGFGGREFKLNMKNGTTKILKGPWSSGSYAMNRAGFGPCVEVSISTHSIRSRNCSFMHGSVTVNILQNAVKFINDPIHIVKHFDSYVPSLHPHRVVAWKIVNKMIQRVMYSNRSSCCYAPLENGISYLWKRENFRHV